MTILSFPRHYSARRGLAGFLLGRIEVLASCDPNRITVSDRRECMPHDVHHAFVRIEGDDRPLQVIVAPVDAKIEVAGRPVAALFPLPEETR